MIGASPVSNHIEDPWEAKQLSKVNEIRPENQPRGQRLSDTLGIKKTPATPMALGTHEKLMFGATSLLQMPQYERSQNPYIR